MTQEIPHDPADQLIEAAFTLGASDAGLVPSSEIVIDDSLARKCIEPGCPNYGLSYSCPPFVKGPDHLRMLCSDHPFGIVVRLIIPSSSLLSWERVEVGKVLHEIVAQLELEAVALGFSQAKAFAGDSCKVLFCRDHLNCRRMDQDGSCRHPNLARPSMSGYGVDVYQLIRSAGWETNLNKDPESDPGDELSWVAGLILLG